MIRVPLSLIHICMSECSPVISNNTPENHKPGSIGRPLENVEIKFENGEILVKGTSVMKGYYQMPDETAETLKDGWLHTGDKGYMDEDGYLFINGRVKNLIILSNGENVSPEELENKLALNPLVAEVIVTGEENGLTARIYPEQAVVEAKALDTEMIRSQLQEFLDEYNKNQPTYRRITGQMCIRDRSKAWCLEQKMQDCYIKSIDGLKLHALYLPAEAAKRIVILSHGYRGSRFGTCLLYTSRCV